MIGLLTRKYHIAILENGTEGFISRMEDALKSWYNNRIVIRTYSDSREMFEAVNINKAKNIPFDLAVLSPALQAEKMVLQQTNPSLKIVACYDENTLRLETSKVLL